MLSPERRLWLHYEAEVHSFSAEYMPFMHFPSMINPCTSCLAHLQRGQAQTLCALGLRRH